MSKVVFLCLIALLPAYSRAANSTDSLKIDEEKDPCDGIFLALNHWAAQMEQDTNATHSFNECMKEATVAKQSFPKIYPQCEKLKFSDLHESTRHYWLNHVAKGVAKPTPDVKIGPFSQSFRLDSEFHIEQSCKQRFPQ